MLHPLIQQLTHGLRRRNLLIYLADSSEPLSANNWDLQGGVIRIWDQVTDFPRDPEYLVNPDHVVWIKLTDETPGPWPR